MHLNKKLLSHLEHSKVKHEVVVHRTIYTAYDAAATMHLPLKQIAKNLLVKADSNYALAIVPADKNIDLNKLKKVINSWIEKNIGQQKKDPVGFKTQEKKYSKFNLIKKIKKVDMPNEAAMAKAFNVKPGGMHAFGSVYRIPVFLDKTLRGSGQTVFNGGSFTESVKLKSSDFVKLESAVTGVFSKAKKRKRKTG